MTTEQTYEKIDPEFKVKWLAALRSGEYQQARGALLTEVPGSPAAFCCLGVACNLIDSTRWQSWEDQFMDYAEDEPVGPVDLGWGDLDSGNTADLPFIDVGPAQELARLNDGPLGQPNAISRPYSFAEIADWIEENL